MSSKRNTIKISKNHKPTSLNEGTEYYVVYIPSSSNPPSVFHLSREAAEQEAQRIISESVSYTHLTLPTKRIV